MGTLEGRVLEALKRRRGQLHGELVQVHDAIELFQPPPKVGAVPIDIKEKKKILDWLGNRDGKGWATYDEVRKGIGGTWRIKRLMEELVGTGRLEKHTFNKVVHYRRVPEQMTLRAGYGEEKPRRRTRKNQKVRDRAAS